MTQVFEITEPGFYTNRKGDLIYITGSVNSGLWQDFHGRIYDRYGYHGWLTNNRDLDIVAKSDKKKSTKGDQNA